MPLHIQSLFTSLSPCGVKRFGEIKDPGKRKEAEYILIGSLLSFGLAMATGYIIRSLIK